jgi:hypothetical protein
MRHSILRIAGWMVLGAFLFSGCATSYLLENNVQSFSSLAGQPPQPTYRFERLPLQESPAQAQLEAIADPALHKAGLRRDDANARYSVQLSARVRRVLSPWATPWDGWGWGGWSWGGWGWGTGFGRYGRHGFGHIGAFGRMEPPWYQREVDVIVRELPSSRVVFESHAANDGPWLDHNAAFAAMFEAALQGFPNPPAGPRRVAVQIGQ